MTIEHTFSVEFNEPEFTVLSEALRAYRETCKAASTDEHRRESAEWRVDRLESLLKRLQPAPED